MNSDRNIYAAKSNGATVINDKNALRNEPLRRTVLRMNAVKKLFALYLFIQKYIADTYGSQARNVYYGIVRTMCSNNNVKWSTNAALSTPGSNKYRKTTFHQLRTQ